MTFRCGCAHEPRPGRADRCLKHANWACHLGGLLEGRGPRRISLAVRMGPGDCPPCAAAKQRAVDRPTAWTP